MISLRIFLIIVLILMNLCIHFSYSLKEANHKKTIETKLINLDRGCRFQ